MKYNNKHLEIVDTILYQPHPEQRIESAQLIADAIYDEIRPIVRERNKLRKALKEHTAIAKRVIAALDAEMKKPSDVERGKRIAKIVGALEFENDSKRHFDLGEEFPLSR